MHPDNCATSSDGQGVARHSALLAHAFLAAGPSTGRTMHDPPLAGRDTAAPGSLRRLAFVSTADVSAAGRHRF
ncbi:hypothetical protein BUPH_08343 (plasmid) [Paraburkholderia phenoliruptrix BR3459a]|uniref:Uncharacterized protein n=1 Tax=Paraburkholderia phenoliruptrix BR3459a TaxID=1229205 RepID=K0E2Q5_9BURK|nr:hypothetical protein BUPH_08343 [Paraburkholderia phenoliruptrix BR3459a]